MGKAAVSRNVLNAALYITFFPQLVSGPITGYADFEPSLTTENRKMNLEKFADGIWIFAVGMAKKVIISNNIASIVDFIYGLPGNERTAVFAWAGALGYLIQLYFDFSGYSDMAMGLSKMFGFNCAKNFDYPYASKSIGEFWRRWHITLGAWFRNYIYIPLGGNRHGKTRTIFNMLIVWVVTGIWHGAGLKFPIWGLLWFVFIVGERFVLKSKTSDTLIESVGKHIYFVFVSLLIWVLFRADSFSAAITYYGSMFGATGNLISNGTAEFISRNWLIYLLGIVLSLPIVPLLRSKTEKSKSLENAMLIAQPFAAAVLLIVSLSGVVAGTYNSFIYFNF
jgi:alginate O-acetyltransferase complex protein AlgI